jgi:hypothetical protein
MQSSRLKVHDVTEVRARLLPKPAVVLDDLPIELHFECLAPKNVRLITFDLFENFINGTWR